MLIGLINKVNCQIGGFAICVQSRFGQRVCPLYKTCNQAGMKD
jgi:hypothetical protein